MHMDDECSPQSYLVDRIATFYDFLKVTSRKYYTVCLWGGAGSGKSVAACQEMVDRLFTEDDIRILMVRKTGPSLTITTYQMVLDIIESYGYVEGEDYILNKTERSIKVPSLRNIMWFQSMDKAEKKKSLNINYAYIEEATELTWHEYEQIELRIRRQNNNGENQCILSWNPSDEYHWTKVKLLDFEETDPTLVSHHSTHMDNPFLPRSYRRKLQLMEEKDPDTYKIYALGQYVTIKNIIYSNWIIDNKVPFNEWTSLGLDFGFNNPSCLVGVRYHDGEFYVEELLYQTNLTNKQLIDKIINLLPLKDYYVPIYCDSAEPDRIQELKDAGLNAKKADKNIKLGIDTVKGFKLHIQERATNLLKEIRTYKWREYKEQTLDEPVGFEDHAMDALRYAIYSLKIKPSTGVPPTPAMRKNAISKSKMEMLKSIGKRFATGVKSPRLGGRSTSRRPPRIF